MQHAEKMIPSGSSLRIGLTCFAFFLLAAFCLGQAPGSAGTAHAQTFTVLHNFKGSGYGDGVNPRAGLVRDAAGNLYGTTVGGGSLGYGTVFKVNKSGKETVLYSFAGGTDGIGPFARLVRDAAGNLYGTTVNGGSSNYGTVFKVSNTGKETVLHSFAGAPDGCSPFGGLLRDGVGNLYGTTYSCGAYSYGTVFKIDTKASETVLYNFCSQTACADGANPYYNTSVLMNSEGDLYGVTEEGGTYGEGVVYELSNSGTLTVLHSFAGGVNHTDGLYPYGTPAMDKNGNLYGTTEEGGSSELGIIWKVSKDGTETVLHSFAGGSSDGANPFAGVIVDAKGNLYGDTTAGGSAANYGTVYELNKKGTLTLLHRFTVPNGESPYGGLIRDAKGILYGTASGGGTNGDGTVWKLAP
jgi:uncharacterized repeat protein (TIGR03803 family)